MAVAGITAWESFSMNPCKEDCYVLSDVLHLSLQQMQEAYLVPLKLSF